VFLKTIAVVFVVVVVIVRKICSKLGINVFTYNSKKFSPLKLFLLFQRQIVDEKQQQLMIHFFSPSHSNTHQKSARRVWIKPEHILKASH